MTPPIELGHAARNASNGAGLAGGRVRMRAGLPLRLLGGRRWDARYLTRPKETGDELPGAARGEGHVSARHSMRRRLRAAGQSEGNHDRGSSGETAMTAGHSNLEARGLGASRHRQFRAACRQPLKHRSDKRLLKPRDNATPTSCPRKAPTLSTPEVVRRLRPARLVRRPPVRRTSPRPRDRR